MKICAVLRELAQTAISNNEATHYSLPAGGGVEHYKTPRENGRKYNEQNSQVNHGMSDPGGKAFSFYLWKYYRNLRYC